MKLLTIYIYEAVYHFQLLPQSDSGGGGGVNQQCQQEYLKI